MIRKCYHLFERKVLIGNRKLQWLFESMHRISLRGMNFDQVQSIDQSGELFVLNHIQKKIGYEKIITIMDVGANVGDYSKTLINYFSKCRVYSFEALPSTFEILQNNLKSYDNIFCLSKAVGACNEERLFFSDGAGSHVSSFYPVGSNYSEGTPVSVVSLDSFCEEQKIDQIDFLKIDVEGFELEVLKGAEQMIKNGKILNIQFEFGSNHVTSGAHFYTIFQYLSQYKVSRVLKNGLRLYEDYNKHWEIYLSANYLAELK